MRVTYVVYYSVRSNLLHIRALSKAEHIQTYDFDARNCETVCIDGLYSMYTAYEYKRVVRTNLGNIRVYHDNVISLSSISF